MATLDSFMDPERNNFGLLRLSAAASVVISHAFYLAGGDDFAQPLSSFTRYNLGQHAVHLFFVISGLTVAGSLDRGSSLKSFALARILRIVPGLGVCVLLTTFALGPWVSTYPLKAYFENSLTYLYPAQTLTLAKISGLLPGVFEANPHAGVVNEPLWTLKYEVLCYAVLALLGATGVWRSSRAFLVVVGLSLVILGPITMVKTAPIDGTTVLGSIARLWLCFLFGLILYRYRAKVPLSWLVLTLVVGTWWGFGLGTRLEPILTFVLAGYGAVTLAACPVGPLRQWTNRTDLSYGVYIYGWPISQTLVWAVPGIGSSRLAIVSLLLAAFCGWLSWLFVERPSLRARTTLSSWFRGRQTDALGKVGHGNPVL